MTSGQPSWQPDWRPCPLCGSGRHRALGERGGESHHAGLGKRTQIVRCIDCCGVYPRPFLLPSSNPYDEFPAKEYFKHHEVEAKVATGRKVAREAKAILGRTGRMLELGCGRGDLLRGASAEGWEVCGVEMTPGFVEQAHGIAIEVARVEEAESLALTYDVIILAAILEHLYEPVACLERVFKALAPGGVVFVDVPNECSLWMRTANLYWRLRGRRWAVNLSPTFPPFHVVGFCPASLGRTLATVGLEVVSLETHRWQNELPPNGSLWRQVETVGSGLILGMGATLGMGAGITCWARKPAR